MNKAIMCLLSLSLAMVCSSCKQKAPQTAEPPSASASPVYQFELNDIDGVPVKLEAYRGKVLLLVNVASKCGYTPQYAGLEQLYQRYRTEGLVVLGFPANNFGSQEPGTEDEIKAFCTTNYHVTFPMFAKISVKGDDIHPLYKFLTEAAPTQSGSAGPVTWNFNKFLIGRDGSVVGRYDSKVEPLSPELTGEITKALAEAS
ncbi:MAG: glutathione peroxidase [Sedimentisphaerales bacterium]|jgi:glutathione peroxidase|nr:glutathione peroxidase [Sedimentisphaerales bacterium]HNY80722.1 glutathione peroxidase [Sedimentisphaerales bacterium]HOC65610.1 glutathione peroxidase [Sedimentisphaerales bacterium]HOH66526.1 glutathione peroxidase [Sedimentisphaerales bacterium]HPY51103.1 glutathione peroxidase [Sedimentisphaerales bacterium]